MDKIEIQLEMLNANVQQMVRNQERTNELIGLLIEALGEEDPAEPQRDMDGNLCLPSASR